VATVGGVVLEPRGPTTELFAAGPVELPLALLALEAELIFQVGEGQVTDPFGFGTLSGLLVAVRLPAAARTMAGGLARLARSPRDQAMVAAVAVVPAEGGAVRLAVSARPGRLERLVSVEQALAGLAPDDVALDRAQRLVPEAVTAEDDALASAEYRRQMAGVLARRALAAAWRGASG
jgi:CO/xanthine dehydrogenase FAD-binding subunit